LSGITRLDYDFGVPIHGLRGLTLANAGLGDLSLGRPTLTDLFAKNLAELKQLKRLSLAGSGLSDVGIKHLAGLTNWNGAMYVAQKSAPPVSPSCRRLIEVE